MAEPTSPRYGDLAAPPAPAVDASVEVGHSHGHSHSHGHGDAGPPRVGDATVRVVPAEKTCPVVASLPTQADLERRVADTLAAEPAVAALRTHVRYPNGLACELDVYLEPTLEMGEGVGDLRAAGAGVTGRRVPNPTRARKDRRKN